MKFEIHNSSLRCKSDDDLYYPRDVPCIPLEVKVYENGDLGLCVDMEKLREAALLASQYDALRGVK